MRWSSLSAVLATLAGSAWGFRASQLLHGSSFVEPWATGAPESGAFGRAEAGDVNGDGVVDAWMLDGTDAVLLFDVDATFAPVRVAPAANDLCLARGHALDGRDALAWVDAGGLHVGLVAPADAQLDLRLLNSGPWAGARLVRAADWDADGREDLAGVAADSRTIVLARAESGELAFETLVAFVALADVKDLVPLQWTPDAPLEFAVLTALGVQVHDESGVLLAAFSGPPGGAVARIRQSGTSTDRLAWIAAPVPLMPQWLSTLSQAGIEAQVDLGGVDVVSCLGADSDSDGDDDLLISHTNSYELLWLENRRSSTNPLAESFLVTLQTLRLLCAGPITEDAPENRAVPALVDLDGDGDLDVVFGCEGAQELHVIREDLVDEERARPAFAAASFSQALGRLTATIDAPLDGWGDANALVVDAWRRPNLASFNEGLAVFTHTIALPAGGPITVNVELPELVSPFATLYSLRVRPVQLDALGAVDRGFAACLGTFAMFTADVNALLAEPYAESSISVTGGVPEDPTDSGKLVAGARTKRFATGCPPVQTPIE